MGDKMIGITNDHRGVAVKQELTNFLKELGYNIVDYGSNGENADYPPLAFEIGEAIRNKKIEFGILICGTGIGMSIACNKVKGVRCAKVDNVNDAKLTREHNNANAIAISGELPISDLKDIIKTFLKTPFSFEERHIRRIEMIDKYEH